MMSSLVIAVAALVVSVADAPPLDLLERMDLWEQVGGNDQSFQLDAGVLSFARAGDEPAALLTKRDYENFELAFEFRLERWCEPGLYIHAPRNGAFQAGLEIELTDITRGCTPFSTGALFRVLAPRAAWTGEHDVWHSCKVVMDWPRLRVHVGGELMQDVDLSEHEGLRHRLRRGAIGFQHLGHRADIRNLELRPLPDSEHGTVLFNGTDLAGWSVLKGDATFEVRDGLLVARDGNGYLKYDTPCQDFDLRLCLRTSPAANGGIFFRWKPGSKDDRGNEIQILDLADANMCTGSIYGIDRGNDAALTPGEWTLLQLHVRGSRAVTHVNGVKSAETDALTTIRPGHVVIQMHRDDATIEFKDMVLVIAD